MKNEEVGEYQQKFKGRKTNFKERTENTKMLIDEELLLYNSPYREALEWEHQILEEM